MLALVNLDYSYMNIFKPAMQPGSFLDASEQLIGDNRVFEPHDALFRTAEAQEVDAPIPNDFLIEDRKFLMNVGLEHHLDAGCRE